MHQSHFQGLLRPLVTALQNHRGRIFEANQAWGALCAACTWQQADIDFGEAQDGSCVTGQYAVVACQADFQTATKSQAVDGDGDRFAAGLHLAQGLVQFSAELGSLPGSHATVVGRYHVLDVGAGDKSLLAGSYNHAFYFII